MHRTIFQDDDKGFRRWMEDHPTGFVLNLRRKRSHPVSIMHRAGCAHIQGVRNRVGGAGLTGGHSMKACSEQVDDLLQFVAQERNGSRILVKRCKSCDPIRSDIRMEPDAGGTTAASDHERHVVMVPESIYERSAPARATCLAYHGAICRVCAVDFKRRYGALGDGFMQVHHLRTLSPKDADYVLDPVNDMVPVCPNCHAMLHRGRERPRSVEELRTILELARKRSYGPNGWVERMEDAG